MRRPVGTEAIAEAGAPAADITAGGRPMTLTLILTGADALTRPATADGPSAVTLTRAGRGPRRR
jgi:hypothetical protein